MAISYGIFGSVNDASTEQDLYTVPAATNAKIKVTVTNRAAASATFRVAIVPDGGLTANEDYVAYDKVLPANDTVTSTTFTVNAADVIRAESSTATVTFTVFGITQS